MSVTLTDDQYRTVMRTMTTIARTRSVNARGNEQPLSRERVNLMAREACDSLGWPYYDYRKSAAA